MKFKNFLAIAVLLVAATLSEVAESTVPDLAAAEGTPGLPADAPVPRELEAKNTNVDMTQFEQLRLRHSIKLLPGAKKSVKEVHGKGFSRKLDGGSSDSDFLPEPVKNAIKDMAVDAVKSQMTSSSSDSVEAAPDSLNAAPLEAEEAFYEDGTGLFIAQEQKRILLLQFYEVILNNPKRTPQVDPRIIKLMTNYLQTLEYVYVKQIQHREESPPVLYDYRTDNETASFCDSPPTSLPDQKFLNEDDDYFVRLFDQYNQQQLGVYMSPTQLKQQGLYRKLARHLAEAQVSESQRREAERMFGTPAQGADGLAEEGQTPQERNLKSADKKKQKAAKAAQPAAPEDASKEVPTHFKVIKPSNIDLESDFDTFAPPKGSSKKNRKLKRSVVAADAAGVESGKRQLRARRNPVRANVDGDFPAPIDDPFPIQNANLFRENIMDDTMEILDFFTRQLNIIFERMERLNAANRGLTTWRIKPHWRDFEQAVQYFQALASRNNRITDVLDLIIKGTADKTGVGFMGHFFGEFDRIQKLNRRLANLNHAYSTANIHLRNMHHNLHQMRSSMPSVPQQRRQVLTNQINAQQLAVNRQQNLVNDLKRRVDRGHQYHREVTQLGQWFNRLGNDVAKEARKVRLDYIRLELLSRNMLHTTAIDMTQPRNQRMNLRFFEAAIPQMVTSKVAIVRGVRRLNPRMENVLNSKDRIKSFLDRWSRDLHRRARVRKLKKEDGKGLI